MSKRKVNVRLSQSFYDSIPLDEIKRAIVDAEARSSSEGITSMWLCVNKTHGYYNDIDIDIYIEGSRPETDEEERIREAEERRAHRSGIESRYELYQKLKKEFGDT